MRSLKSTRGRIKVGQCPEVNISKSRNMGIALAAGEIIAFIDDDAVPEPDWLDDLAAEYDDSIVGAVGGKVDPPQRTRLSVRLRDLRPARQHLGRGRMIKSPCRLRRRCPGPTRS